MPIGGLAEVAGRYGTIFCDVWGVLHDGVRKSAPAERALLGARGAGVGVVLLTNSPRLSGAVAEQLDLLDIAREAYDAIVTSGDVTRELIAQARGRVFHIGPARDRDVFAGMAASMAGEDEAETIVATGLFDDERETPADYAGRLARLAARGVPMICANPDVVVHRGARLVFCAGALARDYAALGGAVRMAGKPHPPIYEAARRIAAAGPILAVGDGLATDVRGANDAGLDVLFVSGGIHGEEFAGGAPAAVAAGLAARGLAARYLIHALA